MQSSYSPRRVACTYIAPSAVEWVQPDSLELWGSLQRDPREPRDQVGRLLRPAQRVSSDPRAGQAHSVGRDTRDRRDRSELSELSVSLEQRDPRARQDPSIRQAQQDPRGRLAARELKDQSEPPLKREQRE
jgi:hypothetical protein